jgi:hypothetical protein
MLITIRNPKGHAMREIARRVALLLAVGILTLGTSGCAYLHSRVEDLADIADIGVTYSKDSQWAFYHSLLSTITIGYADSETTFHGLADGRFGTQPEYVKAWGAVAWGEEQMGWGDYRKDDPNTLYCQTVGLVGMPYGLVKGPSSPHYVPT